MKIKNIHTSISASKSLEKIESLLSQTGCTEFSRSYQDGKVKYFRYKDSAGNIYQLESKDQVIKKEILKAYKKPTDKSYEIASDQAVNTAWKLLCDMVEIKCTLVHLGQLEFMEAFFSQVLTLEKVTYYNSLAGKVEKLLTA